MINLLKSITLFSFSIFILGVSTANAQNHVDISLVPSVDAAVAGQSFDLILQKDIDPHWHTYWKNPGESGFPIQVTWDAPEGVKFSDFKWPVPVALDVGGVMNFVFEDTAHLLATVTVPDSLTGETFTVNMSADWLVCKEICIPESVDVSFDLPISDTNSPANVATFKQAYDALPTPYTGSVDVIEENGVASFTFGSNPFEGTDNIFFFSHDWGFVKAGSLATVAETTDKTIFSFPRTDRALSELSTLSGVISQNGKGISITPALTSNIETSLTTKTSSVTLFSAMLFALLGGIVLNLMPCVFPILSMKALSLVKVAEKHRSEALKHGLAYTAGILVSFLAFAVVIVILKSSGADIGWGFQLQNPIVVLLISWLVFMIGLNLLGVFDVSGRLSQIGSSKVSNATGLTQDFLTGVLAVIVATPCTAPFMGVALGYALVQPPLITVLVFLSLGLGLALPFLLLSILPFLQKIMPKPGAWMEGFKQFLAFPMFATTIWLVWVLVQQSGTGGLLAALTGILFLSFVVWVWKYQSKVISKSILAVFCVLGLLQISQLTKPSLDHVIEYSPASLDAALSTGDPVFVNMTAAWCITCKINERVLKNDSTMALFAERNVVYIEGDWTLMNPDITKYLTSFDRTGVPLYIYYPDGKDSAEILPQILTPSILTNIIQ